MSQNKIVNKKPKDVFCDCGQKINNEMTKCTKCGKDIPLNKQEEAKKVYAYDAYNSRKYIFWFFIFLIITILILFINNISDFFALISILIAIVIITVGEIKYSKGVLINVIFFLTLFEIIPLLFFIFILYKILSNCPG